MARPIQKLMDTFLKYSEKENCPFESAPKEKDRQSLYVFHIPVCDEIEDEILFDGYELHKMAIDLEGDFCEFDDCDPDDITGTVWCLFGHLTEGGVDDIGDFGSFDHAWEVFKHISLTYYLTVEKMNETIEK